MVIVLFVCRLNRCGKAYHQVFLIDSEEKRFLSVGGLKLKVAKTILNKMKSKVVVGKNLEVKIDLMEVEN